MISFRSLQHPPALQLAQVSRFAQVSSYRLFSLPNGRFHVSSACPVWRPRLVRRCHSEPLEPWSGYEFRNKINGGAVPKEYILGVMKGSEECMSNGVLAGYPVVDVRAVLVDGTYHDVDSSVLAFQLAARGAFREGIRKVAPRMLEPIMKVQVVTPEEHLGDVIGDLNSRRG
ncbi:hypothetical protein M5K25_019555 [Dendrobium thyrsiflorum]|uniref:Translation elongation factor EFG/EF2 domain-containing protein n=1 Tax=Dendrobium thyrsiflorum TaxID=117978 RepID=A0ABD0UFC8_DENTH